jgi:hypothetical protein
VGQVLQFMGQGMGHGAGAIVRNPLLRLAFVSAEQLTLNQRVPGSSPGGGIEKRAESSWDRLSFLFGPH